MKELFTLLGAMVIAFLGGTAYGFRESRITTTEIQATMTATSTPPILRTVEYVKMPDGWKCEKPEPTEDLLQPSGYWIMDMVECRKLEMTVGEWEKAHPEYKK